MYFRQLRIEIDSLKSKLATTSSKGLTFAGYPSNSNNNDLESSVNLEASSGAIGTPSMNNQRLGGITDTPNSQAKVIRELTDLRRLNAQLEAEVARLKDEATIQLMRHREEVTQTIYYFI